MTVKIPRLEREIQGYLELATWTEKEIYDHFGKKYHAGVIKHALSTMLTDGKIEEHKRKSGIFYQLVKTNYEVG